jgi:ArsR family transcriptional regulator
LLSRNAEEKTRYFDSIAPEWDAITTDLIGGLDISREIVRRISSCAVAADLGCGTGALLGHLRSKALRVIGVDQSANMLMAARNRYANDSQGIDLRIGSIEHLPMRDREVETAVLNMVLHYLPSPAGGINEASRVLRKGGLLILVDFEKHGDESLRSRHGHRWLGFTKIEIDGWLKSAGFSKIACTHYPINNGLTINLFNTTKQ